MMEEIDEEKLILVWMNTMFKDGIPSVETKTYMALREAIRQYNKAVTEKAEG